MNAAQKTHLRLLGSLNRHKRFRLAAMTAYADLLRTHTDTLAAVVAGMPLTPDLMQSMHMKAHASYEEMIRVHKQLEEE
jgi:hypothetical protein